MVLLTGKLARGIFPVDYRARIHLRSGVRPSDPNHMTVISEIGILPAISVF
jgi:hypothetical protein